MDLASIFFLSFFGVVVPCMAIRSAQKLKAGHPFPPKRQYFINVLTMQLLFALLALMVAKAHSIRLFQPMQWTATGFALAAVLMGGLLGTVPLRWRKSKGIGRQRILQLMPNSTSELGWWLAISLAAGIGEEIVWRGVFHSELWYWTGSWWLATGVASVIFGVAHMVQGWKSVVIISGFALFAHGIVWFSGGSLYLAMFVHATYDFLAGYIYMRLIQKSPLEPAAPVAESGGVKPPLQ